jgi:hypothetical protein
MPFDGAAIRRGLLRGEAGCDRAVIASPTALPETDFPRLSIGKTGACFSPSTSQG